MDTSYHSRRETTILFSVIKWASYVGLVLLGIFLSAVISVSLRRYAGININIGPINPLGAILGFFIIPMARWYSSQFDKLFSR